MDNPAEIQVSMSAICEEGSRATRPDIPKIASEYITADRPATPAAFLLVWKQTPNSTNNPAPSPSHNTYSSRVNQMRFRSGLCPGPCQESSRRSTDSVFGWGWGYTSPLSTPRRLRCLVLGTSPFNPSNEAFLLFVFDEMTTAKTSPSGDGLSCQVCWLCVNVRVCINGKTFALDTAI